MVTGELALVSLSGLDSDQFLERVLQRLPDAGWRFVLLYVIDTRPAEEIGYVRQSLFRGRLSADKLAQMSGAEDKTAQDVLGEARDFMLSQRPNADVAIQIARGRPEQEIVKTAGDLNTDLVVIGARYQRGTRPAVGPHSVGHVARFVLDHAPCDVLLIRGELS